MTLQAGQVLRDRYRIDALLGQGGMGAVYRATDLSFDAPVAIKENQLVTPASQKQFAREARLLYQLRHANLPRVIDHFELAGQGQYLVMDYVAGEDLGKILERRGPIPQAEALGWIAEVLSALEYLHGQGIIHRDVKPANIRITPDGRVFLVDFGLAKEQDPLQQTTTGARALTPGYAPPEQYGYGRTDARSDIYSVGATLYALLTGRRPPDALEHLVGRAQVEPPRQINPAIDRPVEVAMLHAMEARPEDRYQTARAFREALPLPQPARETGASAALPPAAKARRPRWFWPAAGAAVVLTAALILGLAALLGGGADRVTPASPPAAAAQVSETAAPETAPPPTNTPERPADTPLPATSTPEPAAEPSQSSASPPPIPPTDTPQPPPPAGEVRTRLSDGMALIYVPAGEFPMGSVVGASDEKPVHSVYLDAYYIDKYEVTNAQYLKCVVAGACQAAAYATDNQLNQDQQPVVGVAWDDAKTYCQWAGARLPTEAEWENAARGTDGRIYPWGNVLDDSKLNFCDHNCEFDWKDAAADDGYERTAPVGSYPAGASPYGALDMAGNVWEWTADWYAPEYYGRSPGRNPPGPDSGELRVLRGGAWLSDAYGIRAAYRNEYDPTSRYYAIGFRCAAAGSGE